MTYIANHNIVHVPVRGHRSQWLGVWSVGSQVGVDVNHPADATTSESCSDGQPENCLEREITERVMYEYLALGKRGIGKEPGKVEGLKVDGVMNEEIIMDGRVI